LFVTINTKTHPIKEKENGNGISSIKLFPVQTPQIIPPDRCVSLRLKI